MSGFRGKKSSSSHQLNRLKDSGQSNLKKNTGSDSCLAAGIRSTKNSFVTMERTIDEKLKYPDRINLDKKGLHGMPLLTEEPDLRLLSLQHNLIKRVMHLECINKLVFLDLYHNRIEQISGLEHLIHLRVLLLGKNRIKKMEGLSKCENLSVLDLHGNKISQVSGLDKLVALKVLNLAGNQIRRLSNMSNLKVLEELNVRRNHIKSISGLESIITLEKLYISNNEIQNTSFLKNIDSLVNLHTVQMEGNPVWSSSDYTFYLVYNLKSLKLLDQQEITAEIKTNANKWNVGEASSSFSINRKFDKRNLLSKMEQRNISISNAKMRWGLVKQQAIPMLKKPVTIELPSNETHDIINNLKTLTPSPDPSSRGGGGEESEDESPFATTTTETSNPSSRCISRQTSKSSLFSNINKLTIPSRSQPQSPIGFKLSGSDSEVKISNAAKNYPTLQNRRFILHQKFVNLPKEATGKAQYTEPQTLPLTLQSSLNFFTVEKKIGFFNHSETSNGNTKLELEENIGEVSDSASTSTSSEEDSSGENQARGNLLAIRSSKRSYKHDYHQRRNVLRKQIKRHSTASSSKFLSPTTALDISGSSRTSEQGKDYLIELDGDLLSVYGHQSLKFLDRPWNRNRAHRATLVQFNFVSFDELTPYLSRFRSTFPNVDNFEFVETGIHCLGQLNCLAELQGIKYLTIVEGGNPIFHKENWQLYAIYRLEHWGLKQVNHKEISDVEIMKANKMYGSLGELSILAMPQSQILGLIKKFEFAAIPSSFSEKEEPLSLIKDPLLREIVAKESLIYRSGFRNDDAHRKNLKILENLIEIGHSALHKFGKLEDEWDNILPILVKRIVSQFSDIRKYKKESLGRLQNINNDTFDNF